MKKAVIIAMCSIVPILVGAKTVELPPEIKNLEEQYSFLTVITKPINDLQNQVVPKLEQEKDHAHSQKIFYDITDTSGDDGVTIPSFTEKSERNYWMYSIYEWLLISLIWLFTTSLGILVLIGFGLYLIIKILMRLFRPRTRIIS